MAFLLFCAGSLRAQEKIQEFKVDGIKVILNPTKANQIVSVLVGVEGGYGSRETENPSLAQMAASVAAASGSAKYPKEQYRAALSRLVTSINGTGGPYATMYSLSCVKPKFAESWDIFSDVIRNPTYDPDELEHLKEQEVSGIQGRKAEPESAASFMLDSLWAMGYRLGRVEQETDVNTITVAQMKALHDKLMERSRMTIVAVGDISKDELTRRIHESFGPLPNGAFHRVPFERIPGPGKTDLVLENRQTPTTYIFGRFVSPDRKDKDYWPLRIATLIMADRLYEEVRTRRNLSYAPSARTGGGFGNYYTGVSVSTTMPDSTMNVIAREMRKMHDNGVTAKELRDTKAQFVTSFYMSQQSNIAQAQRLFATEMETGNWRDALKIKDEVQKVTLADVQRAVRNYYHTIYWTAVGDESKITRNLFLYP